MIVDDEPFAREDLRQMLEAHPEINVLCEAGTIKEAEKHLTGYWPNLIFLDIQLRGGTGFDLIPSIPPETKIIFITAFDQYAVRAFTINALDYILKPVTPERLAESVRRLSPGSTLLPDDPEPMTPDDKVFIKTDACMQFVPIRSITVISSIGGNYIAVETVSGKKLVCRKTIRAWENLLPESVFIRVHRSTLVNIDHVERFEIDERGSGRVFVMGSSEPILVSVRMVPMLKKRLSEK